MIQKIFFANHNRYKNIKIKQMNDDALGTQVNIRFIDAIEQHVSHASGFQIE
jgi:hypothetical protein